MAASGTTGVAVERVEVVSDDGTPLAVWVAGTGPAVVLVHGSLLDHHHLDPVALELRAGATTYAMDRRGFGGSGDRAPYALEREFEDVAAVAGAAAAASGAPVTLFGHSYGANCALGGAALAGDSVGHLVLYEPSLGLTYPEGAVDAIEAAVAGGDTDGAVASILTGVLELSADEVAERRSSPEWPAFLAAAATITRECRVEEAWVHRPGRFAAVTASVLLLAGSDSPEEVRRATDRAAEMVPRARIEVLEGHGHLATADDPALVAAAVRRFVSS